MIHFHTVRYKNLLSAGNAFTELRLDEHPTTLVVGENGSGKCLDKFTEVDVEFDSPEIEALFRSFLP